MEARGRNPQYTAVQSVLSELLHDFPEAHADLLWDSGLRNDPEYTRNGDFCPENVLT